MPFPNFPLLFWKPGRWSTPRLSFWGEWSLSSTITSLNLVDRNHSHNQFELSSLLLAWHFIYQKDCDSVQTSGSQDDMLRDDIISISSKSGLEETDTRDPYVPQESRQHVRLDTMIGLLMLLVRIWAGMVECSLKSKSAMLLSSLSIRFFFILMWFVAS
jgi:hypothetical protein